MGLAASRYSDTGRLASSSVRSAAGALCRAAAALLFGLPLLLGFVAGAQAQTSDPEISISGGPAITEGEEAIFTLTADPAPSADLEVTVAVSDPSGFIEEDDSKDFDRKSGTGEKTVTIKAGEKTATLRVETYDDCIEETSGEVVAWILGRVDGGYSISSTMDLAGVTVKDNDDTGTIDYDGTANCTNPPPPAVLEITVMATNASSVTEGTNAVFTVTADPAPSTALSVSLNVTEDETNGRDFVDAAHQGTKTLDILTSGSATWTVLTVDDSTDEPNGRVTVTVAVDPESGYTVSSSAGSASITVNDNDGTTVTDTTAPRVTSITRQNPSTSPTNADSLTWRVTFNEVVSNVNAADFAVSNTTATITGVSQVSGTNAYDVIASGGNLAGLNATVTLSFQSTHNIADISNNALTDTAPTTGTNDNTYDVDNTVTDTTAPRVTSIRVHGTPSENNPRLTWRVTFSEPVTNVDTEDFTITGTTASLTSVASVDNAGTTWDVTTSGGDLLDLEDNARVTLGFASGQDITDTSSNPLPATTLTSTYIVGSQRVARITSDWLVRFGRTVAEQGLDSIAQRLRAPRTAGTRASAGGLDLFGTAGNVRQEHPKPFQDRQDPHAPATSRSLNDVLPGSHFLRVGETDAHGGSLALWGRAAHTSFDGKEKDLALDGESTAVMLGADYARQDWLGGLILNHSEGEGGYRDPQSTPGDIEASLTTLIPWAALQAREDLQFWGALGVGKGDLELEPDGSDRVDTDIDWSMAAAGIRSDLISPGGNQGMSLTLVGDALWTRTGADRIEGLSVESGEVTRFRLGLEGDYGRVLETGAEVTPRLEVGVRQDGGDAETGAGFEFGGGMSWRDPDVGLKLELAGRTLMAHDSDDLEEEGFSVSLDYDPRPDSARGLSLSVHQEVGARSTGGLDSLFSPEPLTSHDDELENRVRMEAAYGQPVLSGSFIAGPRAGLIHSSTARDYSLGWRLTTPRRSDLSLDIRVLYLDHDGKVPEHAAVFEMMTHW